jgi:hypothetical protein
MSQKDHKRSSQAKSNTDRKQHQSRIRASDVSTDVEASALWYFYWAVTLGSPWDFVTGGGFHFPVSDSDFGP